MSCAGGNKEKKTVEDNLTNSRAQYSRRMSDLKAQSVQIESLEGKIKEDLAKIETLERSLADMNCTIVSKEEELKFPSTYSDF